MYYTSRVVLYFSLVLKSPFYENELLNNCLIYIYIYHYTALKIFTLVHLTSLQKMKSLTSLLVHMHHPLISDMKHALLPMSTWLLNAQPHEVRGAPTTSLTT